MSHKSVEPPVKKSGASQNMYGISRRIDDLGRLVIPKEIRKTLGWQEGDLVDILMIGKEIRLSRIDTEKKIENTHKHLINLLKDEKPTPNKLAIIRALEQMDLEA